MKFITSAFLAKNKYPLRVFFKPFLIKTMSFTFPVKSQHSQSVIPLNLDYNIQFNKRYGIPVIFLNLSAKLIVKILKNLCYT